MFWKWIPVHSPKRSSSALGKKWYRLFITFYIMPVKQNRRRKLCMMNFPRLHQKIWCLISTLAFGMVCIYSIVPVLHHSFICTASNDRCSWGLGNEPRYVCLVASYIPCLFTVKFVGSRHFQHKFSYLLWPIRLHTNAVSGIYTRKWLYSIRMNIIHICILQLLLVEQGVMKLYTPTKQIRINATTFNWRSFAHAHNNTEKFLWKH